MVDTLGFILKKYNIEVGRQYVVQLPIIGAEGLAHLFADLDFNLGVEIGTDEGKYAEVLLKTIPNLGLYCVDPWLSQAYELNQQPESFVDQSFFDKRYKETLKRLSPYKACRIIRQKSMDALSHFIGESLDFVYIDGNHDFLNVTQDMHSWLKKIRPGGILSGHDYVRYPSRKFNHVQKVVNAYSQSYHLLPVFLVTPTNKGLRRDRYRSWFIVKP